MLTEEERRLFSRLSVFAGGCTLEAAEEVAEAEIATLHALVDKSLVRKTDERFRMLETIREYAAKRLDESGGADVVLERLGKHLIALAVAEGAPGFMERQAEAYDRLEPEHTNTRTVMGWALAEGRYELAAELTVLAFAWIARGHLSEARGWFDAVLEARPALPTRTWGRIFIQAIDVAKTQGDDARTIELAEELVESMGDDPSSIPSTSPRLSRICRIWRFGRVISNVHVSTGSAAWRSARPGACRTPRAQCPRGGCASGGRFRRSAASDGGGSGGLQTRGPRANYVATLEGLAEVARREGDVDGATALLAEALPRAVTLGARAFVGDVLAELAVVVSDRGQSDAAGTLWGAANALLEGSKPWRFRSEPDAPAEAKAAGAAMTLDEAVAYALRNIDA